MNITVTLEGQAEFDAKIAAIISKAEGPGLANALMEGGKLIETACKGFAPVDTGRLRSSISTEAQGENTVIVAPHVDYACIFNSQTRVITDRGNRCIGQIKVGERVLTQTGEYKRVLATNRFSAELKPDLITITAEYRKDRVHKLTATTDHKILTYRDGRNQWIQAGDLTLNDSLYTRIKPAYNKGTGLAKLVKICKNCGTPYQTQGKSFCSVDCRFEYWNNGHNPHTGMKRSEVTRALQRSIIKKRLLERPETHPNRILAQRGYKTKQEREVEEWIKNSGKLYLEQHKIGDHYVDFYLPDDDIAIEADGAFWHQDQERDINRDKDIKRESPDIQIMHVHFYDKRFSKNIVGHPLEDVYYVACNPGMSSYVDPKVFKLTPIIKLEPTTYKRKHGHGAHALYDLTVEGVHSFYANGILVSNSYQEFGTKYQSGTPFMKPGFESSRDAAVAHIKSKLKAEMGL